MTQFEYLPNELIINLFDYLDDYDRYVSFGDLNQRFDQLLFCVTRSSWFTINFSNLQQSKFHNVCKFIKPQDIRSLTLSNYRHSILINQIPLFFNTYFQLDQLTYLQRLYLFDIDESQCQSFLPNLELLQHLSHLTFKFLTISRPAGILYNLSTRFLSLKTIKTLKFLSDEGKIAFVMDKSTPAIVINHIQYLKINLSLDIESLNQLLVHLPHLKSLNIKLTKETKNPVNHMYDTPLTTCIETDIIILTIELCSYTAITFDDIQECVKSVPKLKNFIITGIVTDRQFFDGQRWKQLIDTRLPNLEQFQFLFTIYKYEITKLNVTSFDTWHRVQCDSNQHVTSIYTLPYAFHNQELSLSFQLISPTTKRNDYSRVRQLRFVSTNNATDEQSIVGNRYYPNIDTLILWKISPYLSSLNELSNLIVLDTIRHLDIGYYAGDIQIHLDLLRQISKNLHSLTIRNYDLLDELWIPANIQSISSKTIKVLSLHFTYSDVKYIKYFYQLFPNLEELSVIVLTLNDIRCVVKSMKNLIWLKLKCKELNEMANKDITQWLKSSRLLKAVKNLSHPIKDEIHLWLK
ncbi:unnamed protein product [Didymodactylos carnosus]|uniref:F-box domain-containing protein n=1 Tax=Didymodactylos carnosus TaxID=1234261 RepID=A0A814JV04_9BILA|nr:unnamed protein product [Didymodactylos carnosus]CAF1347599.1 unnamed protein product [Didymodactylos carnosus]CAF3812979.1 unnamed protein product [Didymodactylos carnosus]CAF4158461.1 unnamed protein product [Didymodactylos carnosus]